MRSDRRGSTRQRRQRRSLSWQVARMSKREGEDGAIKVANATSATAAAAVIAGLLATTKRFWQEGCPVKESLDQARLLGSDVLSSSALKPSLALSQDSSKGEETWAAVINPHYAPKRE